MKKSDLKNGMSFETRRGEEYFIIQEDLYRKTIELSLEPNGSFNSYIRDYEDDLTHKNKHNEDIVKIGTKYQSILKYLSRTSKTVTGRKDILLDTIKKSKVLHLEHLTMVKHHGHLKEQILVTGDSVN